MLCTLLCLGACVPWTWLCFSLHCTAPFWFVIDQRQIQRQTYRHTDRQIANAVGRKGEMQGPFFCPPQLRPHHTPSASRQYRIEALSCHIPFLSTLLPDYLEFTRPFCIYVKWEYDLIPYKPFGCAPLFGERVRDAPIYALDKNRPCAPPPCPPARPPSSNFLF